MKQYKSLPESSFEEIQRAIESHLESKNLFLKTGPNHQLLIYSRESGKKPVTKILWGLIKIEGQSPNTLIAIVDFNGTLSIKILKKDIKPFLDSLANEIHDQLGIGVTSTFAA